jgi:hypothetical protein
MADSGQGHTKVTHPDAVPFDDCHVHVGYWDAMDAEQIIDEIEQLEEMFEASDISHLVRA